MLNKALAIKLRPINFSQVVGQEHILLTLINSLKLNKIHHAYIFSGMHGIGKTTIARIFAKSLNCINGITSNPCENCISCIETNKGYFVDLIEVDAASRTKVEDTIDLLNNIQYSPSISRFKIYLIDEIHMLSKHSFNALLKTLEEPPSYVKFLLATTNLNKIPLTILSRCIQLHLKALSNKEIYEYIKKILFENNIYFEKEAINLISEYSNSSLRDALSITDQAIVFGKNKILYDNIIKILGIVDNYKSILIIEALIEKNIIKIMLILEDCYKKCVNWDSLLINICNLLHKIYIFKIAPNFLDKNFNNIKYKLEYISKKISIEKIHSFYKIIISGRKELIFYPNKKIGIEMILLQIINAF